MHNWPHTCAYFTLAGHSARGHYTTMWSFCCCIQLWTKFQSCGLFWWMFTFLRSQWNIRNHSALFGWVHTLTLISQSFHFISPIPLRLKLCVECVGCMQINRCCDMQHIHVCHYCVITQPTAPLRRYSIYMFHTFCAFSKCWENMQLRCITTCK